MYNPTMRLLSILELLQSREQVSGQELAQTLEVDERSIRRYIMMLRDMGIPIESERGRYGGYALLPGFRLPPMMFSHEEIVAVIVGLMVIQELGAFSILAVDSATAKIERVLPEELRQQSQALRRFLTLDMILWPTHSVSGKWLVAVGLAALEKRCLSITYMSAMGETTRRVISPYGIVLHGKTWYLPAYCHLRDGLRNFRLDRVREIEESNHDYEEAASFDPKAYVLNSLATMPGAYTFEVLLHAPLDVVAEYIPSSMAILEDKAGDTLMRCYSDDPHWLARYLTTIELPFTVQQTNELREAFRALAENILASI